MPDQELEACTYRILRYTPNLVRDEWVNIGVLLHDRARNRLELRLLEDDAELVRVRRLHPQADLDLLRALPADFEAQVAAHAGDPAAWVARLDDTLSNLLQLSPQKAVLTEDAAGELDRLYRDHVEAPRARLRPAEVENTRAGIRGRAAQVFRRAGLLERMQRGVRVEEFTEKGDPFRLDFAYQRNGTRGFIHALALARDPAQAKVLAYTAEHIRARLASAELAAVTEVMPRPENDRHRFVSRLLADAGVDVVSMGELEGFSRRLRAALR